MFRWFQLLLGLGLMLHVGACAHRAAGPTLSAVEFVEAMGGAGLRSTPLPSLSSLPHDESRVLSPMGEALPASSPHSPVDLSLNAPDFLDRATAFVASSLPEVRVVGEASKGEVPFIRMLRAPVPADFQAEAFSAALGRTGILAKRMQSELTGPAGVSVLSWRYRGTSGDNRHYRGFCADWFDGPEADEFFVQLWASEQGIPRTYLDEHLHEELADRRQKLKARDYATTWDDALAQRALELERELNALFPNATVSSRAILGKRAAVHVKVHGPDMADETNFATRLQQHGFPIRHRGDVWLHHWDASGFHHDMNVTFRGSGDIAVLIYKRPGV